MRKLHGILGIGLAIVLLASAGVLPTAVALGCFSLGVHAFPITDAEVTITTVSPAPIVGTDTVKLSGPSLVLVGVPGDSNGNGKEDVATELVSMDLAGVSSVFGPIQVTESPAVASNGMIEQLDPSSCFPATSFFDVFAEVHFPALAHNEAPFHMQTRLDTIPPQGASYGQPGVQLVAIFSGPSTGIHPLLGETVVGSIKHAMHVPLPERPLFSVAPGGTSGLDPGDLYTMLIAGGPPIPVVTKMLLGLQPGDDIDALMFSKQSQPATDPIFGTRFSVRPGSVGLPGTGVAAESSKVPSEAQADEFQVSAPGDNTLYMDQSLFGLFAPDDDLDALAWDFLTDPDPNNTAVPFPLFFSLAPGSPSLAAIGATPGDVLISTDVGPPAVFHSHVSLGLAAADDIDAMCAMDLGGGNQVLFSLSASSPSLDDTLLSAADILSAGPTQVVAAGTLGLLPSDDLDALKCGDLP